MKRLRALKLRLTPKLPQTIILEKDSLTEQMIALFERYIVDGSDHELNIPFDIKSKLITFFGKTMNELQKQKDSEIFTVFDECCYEILSLINDPFQRFIHDRDVMHNVNRVKIDKQDFIDIVYTQ
eukprot:UN04305